MSSGTGQVAGWTACAAGAAFSGGNGFWIMAFIMAIADLSHNWSSYNKYAYSAVAYMPCCSRVCESHDPAI